MKGTYVTLKGSSYIRFYSAIRARLSRRTYPDALKHYAEYLQRTGVITDATDAEQLLAAPDIVENWLMSYITWQREDGLSFAVIATRLAGIKLYYEMNKVNLAWKLIRKTMGEEVKHEDRPYTHEEIKTLLSKCDPRGKVAVLLMASAGLRVGAVADLRIGNFKPINEYGIYQVTVYEGTKDKYITFCSPECRDAIDDYLNQRKRLGEKIESSSPLLRQQYNRYKTDAEQIIKPLRRDGVEYLVREALILSGLRTGRSTENEKHGRKRHEVKASHGLRKFFATQLSLGGVDYRYVERLMGHDLGLTDVYFKSDPIQMLEGNDKMGGYIEALDTLTIHNERRLQRKVKELEIENLGLIEVRKEIDAIKEQLRNQ